ncbi:hypothetical protein CPB84DRAFT_1783571 [Gymnopilus junonius]|uniref:SWIM-type domain-containing protein n=1 Tax=Gymnopilus junonius TaxID=109634 RepID=A0A9P5TKJ5_GYMJU|nr:hypothetical protein CPB84DRAFT_1783571 [Gymnopilus junonius]
MPFDDLLLFANAAINSIKPGSFIHYVTPWGHTEYEVIGSTARYSIILDMKTTPIPYSCTLSETHIMCKHILATLIARRLNRCSMRSAGPNDLAVIFARQFPIPEQKTANE